MKLFYRKFGEGKPVIILHGLFGQSDNWKSFGKQLENEGYCIYLIDARNHGQSPHSSIWNYQVMSDDVFELITEELKSSIGEIILIGHSMGGKTAMQFAIDHPQALEKLIVVDIAPKYYPPHHQEILKGLNSIKLNTLKSRKEADEILSHYISDFPTKQFLLKNLYRSDSNENSVFKWRFNLEVISSQIENIGKPSATDATCNVPTLFIRGENSNYILDEDFEHINNIFTYNIIETIENAGHWLHAEKPKEFYEKVISFIR